ncbi:MAG: glycosyltransferase [Defluviitaleaceae bacterium]|nr:glycosyltransferase [Defluviitaleaceae bacterium]
MIEKLLVSVIIPVYNAADFLFRCLDSVLAQTHTHLEVILINDGSVDQSGNICDQYAQHDNRIKVIHQKNGGVSAARNVGLNYATGDWVGFVDADDWIEPNMYEKMIDAACKSNRQIVVCGHSDHRLSGTIHAKSFPKLAGTIEPDRAAVILLSDKYFEGYPWNKLFKRKHLLRTSARFDEKIHFCEDVLFSLQLFLQSDGICYIPDVLYHHCINENSAMVMFKEKRLTELDAWSEIISVASIASPTLIKTAKHRFTQGAINIFYMQTISASDVNMKRISRKEVRYKLLYFTSFQVTLRQKISGFLKLCLPKTTRRIWVWIKNLKGPNTKDR